MEAEYYDEEMHSEEDAEFEEYYDHDEDVVAAPALTRSDSYTLLKPGELEARQQRTIDEMAELFGVTPSEAGVLLRHYKWNKNALQEAWFDNEAGVRRKVGLGHGEAPAPPATVTCPVCYDDVPAGRTYALCCGHRLCADCWAGYVNNQVEEGPNCIFATCPEPSCPEVVTDDVVRMFASPAMLDKYRRYVLHSYVDHNKNVKWCPSPGCQNAVEYPSRGAREIRCSCSCIFCFNCEQEGHRPTDCETVVRWGMKNSAESENVTWILANTKQCPICRKPIEKNQGCNHMTCFKNAGGCGHEFCWLCLGPWTEHGSTTGGYYKCNKYEKAVKEGKMKEDERARVKAKTELDKYMFYFERYVNHEQARKMAQKQRPAIESKMQLLHDLRGYPISELQFLLDALEQLIECRRVLKWTYPFGYYLTGGAEKNLFEHLQQQLEENTEHLHEMLEKPLDPFLDPAQPDRAPFYAYKSELTNYANVTKKFLHNLLEGIENGLTSEM